MSKRRATAEEFDLIGSDYVSEMMETGATHSSCVEQILKSDKYPWLGSRSEREETLQKFYEKPGKGNREAIECDGGCGTKNPGFKCTRCKNHYYCGNDCQRKHWKFHKLHCENTKKNIVAHTEDHPLESLPEVEAINTDCPFCLDPVVGPVVIESCRHAFCFACLDHHQSSNRIYGLSMQARLGSSSQCPLCRTEIPDARQVILHKIRMYGARSYARNMPPEESQEWRNKALAEVETLVALGNASEPDEDECQLISILCLLILRKLGTAAAIRPRRLFLSATMPKCAWSRLHTSE